MKRNYVEDDEIRLGMGEVVQVVGEKGDFVVVRKFNGELYEISKDLTGESIEDVIKGVI